MLLSGRWTMIESGDRGSGLTVVPADSIHWESSSDGQVPHGAVTGGRSFDNETLYIGRTRLRENRNELTPGILIPSEKCLLVSYGTGVRRAKEYEVLVAKNADSVHWISCTYGHIPSNSVIGGIDCSYLEPLYIGRTKGDLQMGKTWRGQRLSVSATFAQNTTNEGVQFPGKVHGTHRCLYIPYMGKEYLFRDYEVLALKESPATLMAMCKYTIRDLINQNSQHNLEHSEEGNDTFERENESYISEIIDLLPLPEKIKEYCLESFTIV
ncbi:uncharacterized protein LOC143469506 [Clavelina lepadiformis]|uniref:uncharacterized protein LOC143469506 n=1 Tax=Clavelina lepadiformis TaxID=159417 RepID=UPI0040410643